jgi:hypothetical protein
MGEERASGSKVGESRSMRPSRGQQQVSQVAQAWCRQSVASHKVWHLTTDCESSLHNEQENCWASSRRVNLRSMMM